MTAPSPSRFTAGALTAPPDLEAAVEAEVRRSLVARLLADSPPAEAAQLVILGVVLVMVWRSISAPVLGVWAGAVTACVATRVLIRRGLRAPDVPVDVALNRMRLIVALTGLAWGVGAAAIMPGIPLHKTALLLVVLSGLTAGAVASLAADPWSFRVFVAGLLTPVPIGILQSPAQRDDAFVIFLIALFGASMIVFQRRSFLLLADHIRQKELTTRRERRAEQDRAYLDGLLASAPIAIAVVDGEGQARGANPQFERLFGYTAVEVIGRQLNDLIVPKSEMPKASRLDSRTRRGETVVVEVERRRKDGSLVPVRASARAVEGVSPGDLFVMYEDVSERRRAQDALTQLASIVESSEDAIIGQTLDGTIVTWNAAAQRLFGYTVGEIQGKPISVLAPPDQVEEVRKNLERIRLGEHIEHYETVRLHKNGTLLPVSVSISVTRDATGRISGFSSIARDVREQAAARAALQTARDTAERLARTRSAFLANMSHEIRTPMNAILGLTELLLDTELAPEQRHSLTLVQTSGETLLTLINDILDFSKIEAEHLQLEVIPFDLPHLIDSIIGLLAVRARERRIELLGDVPPDAPRVVRGDPTRLRQVLTNLVGNAIKFTERGEVVVVVAPAAARDGRPRIRFAVRDTGIGIPADKLATIFEEFSQADASTTRKYGGTGLGLAIARRLVGLMGGDLAVTSALGVGTEFSFTLPFEVEAEAPALAPSPGAVRLVGRRALVVDDNPTNRRIVRDVLAAAGVRVAEATDGAAGLAALVAAQKSGEPFDVAILDAQMPELDGFGMAAAVRADPRLAGTRLVMLTSAGQRGDGQRCREQGIQGYLLKPAPRTDLLEAIGAVLQAPTVAAASAGVVTRHTIAESRRHLRVLLAEDNLVNQQVAATMLRKRGHEVDVVGDGRAAVEAVAATTYDVVLMDIQMPEMDGFAATRAIRATAAGRELPIVALTAHALSGEREKCLAQGMSDYLTKPFKAHDLFDVVENQGATREPVPAPTPATPAAVPVDLDAFRHEMRAAGAEEAVELIIDTFLQTAPERIAALSAALTAGAAKEIEQAAHAFKSAAATIGAKQLAALLQQAEGAGRAGEIARARALADELVRASDAVTAYLSGVRGTT